MKKKIITAFIGIPITVGIILLTKGNGRIKVKRIEASMAIVEKTVSASGVVKSRNEAGLAFPTTGRIASITVKKGDFVKEGARIAQLDSFSQLQSVQAAKDTRDIATRNKDIFLGEHAPDEDNFDIQLRKLDEEISKAEANYQAELGVLANLTLKTPFSGTIIDILKEKGELATSGKTVVKMANLDNLFFEVELDQEDFGMIRVGQQVTLELDSYEGTTFTGEVSKLPQYAEANGSGDEVFVVEIEVTPQENHPILLGMTGDASIITEKSETEVPTLSFDVINYDEENKPFVWTVKTGKLAKKYINIGLEGDLLTELKSAEDITKLTIVTPEETNKELKEGVKVKIVD